MKPYSPRPLGCIFVLSPVCITGTGGWKIIALSPSFKEAAMILHRNDTILPDQMRLLDDVFVELLRSRGLERSSKEAELLATRLMSLYQNGIREKDDLRQMASYL
ncbi:hypothetical protein LPJGGPFB_04813 [Ensifer adhaerens]|nr:hypothetical protein [Ensifer adhaerens]